MASKKRIHSNSTESHYPLYVKSTVPVIKKFLSEFFISEKQKDSGNIQKLSENVHSIFLFYSGEEF